MKCRGWSSRVISVCSAGALALTLAPAAGAQAEVFPQRIDPGSAARLVFSISNSERSAITRIAIGLPPDFDNPKAEVKSGWTTEVHRRTVAWEGSRILPDQFGAFALQVQAPYVEERAIFPVLASLGSGRTVTYQVMVTVSRAPSPHDSGARMLATAALIVAAVAVLLALGGGFLALWLWLRPRL